MVQQPEPIPEIENFVLEALKLADATYRELDHHIYEAFVPVKRPPSFFGVEQQPFDRLLLVFGNDPRGLPPEAEMVTPGSYRLGWFIDGLRQRGKTAMGYIPYQLELARIQRQIRRIWPEVREDVYFGRFTVLQEPFLLCNFKASLVSDESVETLDSLAISLVSGEVSPHLPHLLTDMPVRDCHEPPRHTEPHISLEEGFKRLIDTARERMENNNPDWTTCTLSRFQEELQRLRAFFDDRPRDLVNASEAARMSEELVEKFRPRLVLRCLNAARVFLPLITFTYEAIGPSGVRTGNADFRPVTNALGMR